MIEGDLEAMLVPFGITRRQYNVLRILKGVYPGGHPRAEIAARVLEQSPDITRILDRLSNQGLITRVRAKEDKRETLTKITPKGIAIVEKTAPLIVAFTKQIEQTITREGCLSLSELCEKLYKNKVER
jgi:DNA-binding MarR family transcriptional regulator